MNAVHAQTLVQTWEVKPTWSWRLFCTMKTWSHKNGTS